MHEYDADFYSLLASFAVRSAAEVVPLLSASLPVDSVVDFGCGQGAWLSIWRKAGANVTGVDGPYVDRQRLMIEENEFCAADLGRPIDLGRRFDLVQSLEVAEHLPLRQAADFVGTLTAHGPVVMFSAAVPGQGGEHHLNEQPLEYWREMFRRRGFVAIDCIRPQIVDNPRIQHWYRCNILLYVEQRRFEDLPDRLLSFRVPENQKLRNYWPLPQRIRHALIRQLPRAGVDFLARRKAQLAARRALSTGLMP